MQLTQCLTPGGELHPAGKEEKQLVHLLRTARGPRYPDLQERHQQLWITGDVFYATGWVTSVRSASRKTRMPHLPSQPPQSLLSCVLPGMQVVSLQPAGDKVTTGLRDSRVEVTLVHPELVSTEDLIPGKTMSVKGVGSINPLRTPCLCLIRLGSWESNESSGSNRCHSH